MSTTAIQWDTEAKMLGADPAATVSLDRSAWERAGATFMPTDDGNGETPGLATATVETAAGPVQIGVVDYDEPSTYLLVPGAGPERLTTARAVLETLQAAGALSIDRDVLDLADTAPPPTLEDRVADLERRLADTQSELSARRGPPTRRRGKWLIGKAAETSSRSSMQGT